MSNIKTRALTPEYQLYWKLCSRHIEGSSGLHIRDVPGYITGFLISCGIALLGVVRLCRESMTFKILQ